ncbi:hypothetical protein EVAR_27231_1 [Eumeta japonica]|uniref:Uncharacterized protein n=1 Tax=Eumeta variegata TaxID=151549 RepID=A0A4C1VUQ4_EUMVA|nr:hypothetical protein EVAR_27231_1 [Eumeta japonica]
MYYLAKIYMTIFLLDSRFFGFGGPVKKKPGSTSGGGGTGTGSGPCSGSSALSRRRGSDRSLSGSAHELAVCAAQPPRVPEPPPHSHSQSNLCDITFRDPLDDDTADVLPWECTGRESVYGGPRRRQDSAADSGSSSSDVSAAIAAAGERTRRLPQQSTLDGGLRGAPPPLRRLSAVEPRHLAPLASPPQSPRPPRPAPQAASSTTIAGTVPPPHPTPTISVSSAPDDESQESPPETGSPEEPRSLAHSDEPSSVFASADPTPTDPAKTTLKTIEDRATFIIEDTHPSSNPSCNSSRTDAITSVVEVKVLNPSSSESGAESNEVRAASPVEASKASRPTPTLTSRACSEESDRPKSPDEGIVSVQRTLSRQSSTIKEISPASSKDVSRKIGDLPEGSRQVCSWTVTAECANRRPMSPPRAACGPSPSDDATGHTSTPALSPPPPAAPAVAPLAVCEDIGVDDDNIDKVPSAPLQRVSGDSKAAFESDATKRIAHKDEPASVSDSNVVRRDNKSDSGERKKRNDICPWEDE